MKIRFFFLCFLFSLLNFAQEQITSFRADILVDTTSVITITEKIDIISEGNIFKRGIQRNLPQFKTDSAGNQKPFNYRIISVQKDNKDVNYFTEKRGDHLEIYVGDRDIFLDNGAHSYILTYTAENAIGYFSTHDEIYWNVNGFYWDFDFPEITATVTFPQNSSITQSACYTGNYGSNDSNCSKEIDGNTVTFKAENLLPRQNLTIAAGISKGILKQPPPPPPPAPPTWFQTYGLLLISLLLSLFLSLYYFFTWQKHGIDPPTPVAHPQFKVPENLSPAGIGMLHKERYWDDLITASLTHAAINGYIQIKEEKTEGLLGLFKQTQFTLIQQKSPDQNLPKEERALLEKLFQNREQIVLDGKYKSYVEDAVNRFKHSLKDQHSALINEGNNYKFLILPLLLIIGFLAFSLFIGMKYGIEEIFAFVFGGVSFIPFAFFIFAFARSWFRMSLKWILFIFVAIALISVFIFMAGLSFNKQNLNLYSITGFILFAVISFAFYQYYIKKPSEEKLRIQSLIEGFKMYLGAAEEKPIQHFNPPDMTPEIFEKYLPYAIALDSDKIWGEKFQQHLSKSVTDQHYSNGWYIGNNFNAVQLGQHLNSNLSNAISSTATPPSSSSSGSGGGGFSGGGGGGGGGGGW